MVQHQVLWKTFAPNAKTTDPTRLPATPIPRTRAKAYIESYFARYAGVKSYMNETVAIARELTGFVWRVFQIMAAKMAAKQSQPSAAKS